VFQTGNSTHIHLGIGMGFLYNVPAEAAQKGFFSIIIYNKNVIYKCQK
jgi:hypothetical protein